MTEHNSDVLMNINQILEDAGKPISAADVAKELQARGQMPELWSTLDVADFLRDWF